MLAVKIMHWTPRFWPDIGGIEILAMRMLPALRERGYESIVVTSHGEFPRPDVGSFEEIPVYRFRFWTALSKRDFVLIRSIRDRLVALRRSFKPDLVHLHFPAYLAYFHLQSRTVEPCPTLLSLHTDFSHFKGGPNTLFGQVVRSANWVTAVSNATLADTRRIVPEIQERSSVVYNGLKPPDLVPADLPFDPPHILYVGRLVPEKGIDIAISAYATLLQQFPRLRMTIAGDGPIRAELEAHAEAVGVRSAITFAGWVDPDKIPELINTATMVVIPSRYAEPFALIALQAGHMARPVVATRMGGLLETVVDKETGLLVEMENTGALAEAIARLLNHPEEARTMGLAARMRALSRFSFDECVNAYDALYQRLLKATVP